MPNSAHARFSRAPRLKASPISPIAWRRSGALSIRPRLPLENRLGAFFRSTNSAAVSARAFSLPRSSPSRSRIRPLSACARAAPRRALHCPAAVGPFAGQAPGLDLLGIYATFAAILTELRLVQCGCLHPHRTFLLAAPPFGPVCQRGGGQPTLAPRLASPALQGVPWNTRLSRQPRDTRLLRQPHPLNEARFQFVRIGSPGFSPSPSSHFTHSVRRQLS